MDLLELINFFWLDVCIFRNSLSSFFYASTTPDVRQCNLFIICSHFIKSLLNTNIFGSSHSILNKEYSSNGAGKQPIQYKSGAIFESPQPGLTLLSI